MNQKATILDIAMNLNRIGNWAADDFWAKRKRITTFLHQTSMYIDEIDVKSFNKSFKRTFLRFLKEYRKLEQLSKNVPQDELTWAEKMMTWGNILTHRAKLLP